MKYELRIREFSLTIHEDGTGEIFIEKGDGVLLDFTKHEINKIKGLLALAEEQ